MKIRERWITVVLAIAGGFFGAMLWGQIFVPHSVIAAEGQQSKTVTADRIVAREILIVDPAGRQRVALNVAPDDLARLSFLTTSGKRRLAKPPIRLRGLFNRNAKRSPSPMAAKFRVLGFQKLTSSRAP